MSDLFSQVLNGNLIANEDFYKEAAYSESLPYLKTMPRVFYLPTGSKSRGKGNICFLYNNSQTKIMDSLTNRKNGLFMNVYQYYYVKPIYTGKIYSKMYRERIFDQRKELYATLYEKQKKIRPYNKVTISANEDKNIIYELFYHLDIYNRYIPKSLNPMKKIEIYWTYIKSIIHGLDYLSEYKYKFILVNLNDYVFDLPVVKNLANPLVCIYYTLFKNPSLLKELDIDFIFHTDKRVLKFNPTKQELDGNLYKVFKTQMKLIIPSVATNIFSEEEMERDTASSNVIHTISKSFEQKETDDDDMVNRKIKEKVENVKHELEVVAPQESNPADIEDLIQTKAENDINDDEELLLNIYNKVSKKNVPVKPASSARDKQLREAQKDIVVNGMKVKDIQKIQSTHMPIPSKDISKSVKTTNKHMTQMKFVNFDKTYNEKVMPKDIINAIMSLNDKSIPLYVRDIKIEDTSDELNYKDTYTIYLEDANRQRHTVKVDIPKFIEDKFIYIGGNRKTIKKQNFFFPVVKSGPDTVQIVTNYNKMFIRRVDSKSVSSVERMKKYLKSSEEFKKYFKFGNGYGSNKEFVTTIEYDELSKLMTEFKSGNYILFFNQKEATDYAAKNKILIPANTMFIGMDGTKPILLNTETQVTLDGGKSITDLILDHVDPEHADAIKGIHAPKRLMYVKVKVMDQDITVISLLCLWEGLTTVLKKMNVKYELSDKPPKQLAPNQNMLRFKNCYMIYTETVGQSLLLNGLRLMDTTKYDISEFDSPEPFIAYFTKAFGKASIINALNNFYEFTIDPITLEILQDIDLPTDIVSLMIYAVNLLQDSQFIPEYNQSLSRIRSHEIIPAILYEALAKNYINYRNSNGKKKYSVPQDIVIKNLVGLKTVEDYSTLNPVVELETTHAVSNKGFRGINLDRAYTIDKRVYDASMTGIMAPSSSPDGTVGVNKTLSLEPSIVSARGYVDLKYKNTEELDDVNLFSPGELSIPMAATIDDPTRLGHAIKQSKHTIPVEDSSPVLISNGLEETCRFRLSSDFVVNADEDGQVVEYDEETQIMIVKYKSGKCRAVNLGHFIVKNGGGGFFLSNQLITKLKVGDKFKEGDVLAYHKNFFTSNKFNSTRMNLGALAKVAIMSTYNTFQDSTVISQRLAEAASTQMCFMTQAVIGKNSSVTFMVEKGANIVSGDPLVQFDTSYDDNELNVLLANIGNGNIKDQILAEAKNSIKSKYSGAIEEIEMYSTVPLAELSPSLKKIFSKYYKTINKKKELLEKYDPESKNSVVKCGLLCKEPTHEIEPNKYGVIKGQNVADSVLINFYIKHSEPLEIGSKIANFSALKNTIGEIIPEGYDAYSEFRPEETVDTFIASNSILKRMTPSVILTTLGNKCIVELKRALREIYES